jgi:PAS domain S-box-containing protein
MMAVGVVARNPRAPLNRFCALLILTFAFWCGCLAVSHHPASSKETAERFYDLGSLAWGTFASQGLLFAVAFGRLPWLRAKTFWLVLLLPAAATVYAQNVGLLAADYLARPWGWSFVWRGTPAVSLFLIYYGGYMLATLVLLAQTAQRDPSPVRRRQAQIIFASSLAPLVMGTITDVILPRAGIYTVPNCAPDFTVIWVAGLAYAVDRYQMLELRPRFAADQVVGSMSDALLLVDREGHIAWPNPAASRLFGRSTEELRQLNLTQLLGRKLPPSRDGQGPEAEEATFTRADGTIVDLALSLTPLRGSLRETAGWVCLATDVTLRKRAEHDLRQAHDALEHRVAARTTELRQLNHRLSIEVAERRRSEEHHRLLIESMHEGVWVLDAEDRTTLVNSHLAQLLGEVPEAFLHAPVRTFVDPASMKSCDELLCAVHEGRPGRADWRLRRADDQRLSTIVQVSPLPSEGKIYQGCVLTVMDVTERETMQAQLGRAQRLASVGLLAAGVGHEINNPLTYVMLNLEQLKEATEKGLSAAASWVDMGTLVTEALDGARRVQDIVRDLRRFSRGEPRSLAPVDVHEALESALKLGHHQVRFRARLERNFAADLPHVVANAGSLSQVFLNLLVNAAHAMPEDGQQHHVIRIRTSQEKDNVLVEFADTGQGISAEDMERLFDPFFSSKGEGESLGLGLAICHEIVASVGGRIFVGSEVGKGSRFLVVLKASAERAPPPEVSGPTVIAPATAHLSPAVAPIPASAPAGTVIPATTTRPLRVLIIDDEELVARTLDRVLRAHYAVVIATSGEQARQLIAAGPRFDLALCDLMMPGMSGMALAAWVAEHAPELRERMVFMTGGAFTVEAERFLARSTNPVLEKPFVPSEVLSAARKALGLQDDA